MRRWWAAALLVALVSTAGCFRAEPYEGGPEFVPFPDGIAVYLDQSRAERVTRDAFVRLVNDTERRVTVTDAVVSADRFDTVEWHGEADFAAATDLEVVLPPGRCGTGSDATVELTYLLDDGPSVTSEVTATDRYGAIGLLLDRDCTERTFAAATDLEVGDPQVAGRGRAATLTLPVTLTPTGAGPSPAPRITGVEDTVLFRVADPALTRPGPWRPGPGAGPTTVDLPVVPARCDPHALAEDKVGTLFGLTVTGGGLGPDAYFFLPLPEETRADLRRFVPVHCGW